MHVPENMEASELLNIIDAHELIECNHCSGHIKVNGQYRNCGELQNKAAYNIHTSDPNKTVDLIKCYNHRN